MKFITAFTITFCALFFSRGNILHSSQWETSSLLPEEEKNSIAIVGDLQRTSIWEIVLGREQNDFERGQIIKSVAAEDPAMVMLLGDMVFDGSSTLQWDYFDSLLVPLRQKNTPLYPVVGNHEYWGKENNNLYLLNNRFPFLKQKTWYVQTYDSLAYIFLNSNEYELNASDWQQQKDWFNNRLYYFENDPSIKGIIVFTHHPPYTNSTITGDELNVQEAFLPAFNKSNKTMAFISGHAHTYERFRIDGKTFIISGGGGGPRVPLNIGPDCHTDLCKDNSPVRPFNYLLLNRTPDGVKIKVKALEKNATAFFILEEYTIPWNVKYTARRGE